MHLIARLEGDNLPQNNNNNNEENRSSSEYFFPFNFFRRAPSIISPFIGLREIGRSRGVNNDREENSGFPGRGSIRIISSTYQNIGRNPELAPQPNIDPDEMRETIAQNLLEVQNLIEFGNYNEFNENENEEKKNINNSYNINIEKENEYDFNMNCFDLNKRILAKGQWVDVKDTVEQWLDAQVIEVSEDTKMVKIHYNHWSTRWDEWIQTNSPRIMPFRYHTRQSTLNNYHSPYPNKKPDMGITLLSFENLNRNTCVYPFNIIQQRNRNSSVISTSSPQSQNNQNNSNNNNYPPPPPSPSTNAVNISTSEINSNNIISTNSNRNENISTSNNTNNYNNSNIQTRRQNRVRYAEPLPPIPSPKHQEPDPENHIVKNLGEDGFIGIFNEFQQINKVIEGLSSEILLKHNDNTEILTPKKLSEIQNKSYYDLKRLIPILDRTGRIYSDISTFMEHTMRTNQLELLSKNLFAGVERINEDLKHYSTEERRRITQEILSHNHRRENRSGTLNFVPPVNKFETKLINSIPIIDTPYMVGKKDTPQILDFLIQNSNDEGSSGEDNNNSNNINSNNNISENNSRNQNRINNDFIRNNKMESFNIEYEGNKKEEKKIKNNKKYKKIKNGQKMLGNKTKRNKTNKKQKDKDILDVEENNKNKKKK